MNDHLERRDLRQRRNGPLQRFRRRNFMFPFFLLAPLYLIGGLLLFWWLEPLVLGPPERMTDLALIEEEVRPGEPLVIRYRIETFRRCPFRLSRYVVGAQVYVLPEISSTIASPGITEREGKIYLPPLPPGRYEFRALAEWECNPLSTYREARGPLYFEVVP